MTDANAKHWKQKLMNLELLNLISIQRWNCKWNYIHVGVVMEKTHVHMYNVLDVDDSILEQSTIFTSDEDNDSVAVSIINMENPVKLTKTQKKNLKRWAKRKKIHGVQENNDHEPHEKMHPKVIS